MTKDKIENIQKLNSEIQNFKDCYEGVELWGERDGPVTTETLIVFLIENPHFQRIADKINSLDT